MGQAVSLPGDDNIAGADAAMGDEAALAASSSASSVGNSVKVGEKAVEPEEETGSSAPAAGISEKVLEEWVDFYAAKGNDAPAAANGEKKTRTVRMPQAQVDHSLSYTPTRLPKVPDLTNLSEELQTMITESMSKAAELLREFQESHLREQEWVRKQMEEKGYVEYEVDNDEAEEAVVLPRRGRHRYRPGVKITAAGKVKRVN